MRMSRFVIASNGYFVMDDYRWFATQVAAITSSPKRTLSGGLPSRTHTESLAARPSWVCRPTDMLRLPRPHTLGSTEHFVGVEIRRRPGEPFAAPFTGLSLAIRASGIGASILPLLRTVPRAILLITLPRALAWLPADKAWSRRLLWAPTVQEIASLGAIALLWATVLWVILLATLRAFAGNCVSHARIIHPHRRYCKGEIEEKYCKIATERLRQEVLF